MKVYEGRGYVVRMGCGVLVGFSANKVWLAGFGCVNFAVGLGMDVVGAVYVLCRSGDLVIY